MTSTYTVPTALSRALLSVYDKSGLIEFAQNLSDRGVALVATGSTAATIADAGIDVTEVSELTGFPEVLDGRVKTLHPRVHAGILANQKLESHRQELQKHDIEPFDLVVSNLYPFSQTVRNSSDPDKIVENIDIGGPTLIRAAAKNFSSTAVVTDPLMYEEFIEAFDQGKIEEQYRQKLAAQAFKVTADYDRRIAQWMASQTSQSDFTQSSNLPDDTYNNQDTLQLTLVDSLRYGENSHQKAAIYSREGHEKGITQARQLSGKEMSFNNYVDADSAIGAVFHMDQPAVAIIKHSNPCGIAEGNPSAPDPVHDAYLKAFACDSISAFGGVVASNREITAAAAEAISRVFTEVVIAPSFSPEAAAILGAKSNLRLLELPSDFQISPVQYRHISGGTLVQDADHFGIDGQSSSWKHVAGPPATKEQLRNLQFAWKTVASVKSNAILLAQDVASVGIGMGQVNRVDSCRLAVERANTLLLNDAGEPINRSIGSVAASDAFFPFADGLEILIDAGVVAVVQPGGSKRDEEVLSAADMSGVSMYITGHRHFLH